MECQEEEVHHGCRVAELPEGNCEERRSKEEKEMEEMSRCLQEDGLSAEASAEERQRHLWRALQRSEETRLFSVRESQSLRAQRADEMEEVENYVEHIRNMLDDRESLAAIYEQENEQLRAHLREVVVQQDIQLKELAEMLEQEGLAEISHSSPSEQVAYLLVERATLLEKLEACDGKLDDVSLPDSLKEVPLQVPDQPTDAPGCQLSKKHLKQRHSRDAKDSESKKLPPDQSPWKKLFGVRKTSKGPKTRASAGTEDPREGERCELRRLRRDLDEASRRLAMAHQEIRRLTDELDSARKTQDQQEPELLWASREAEQLRQELEQLRESGDTELAKVKEQNERLQLENRALTMRMRTLHSEKNILFDMVENIIDDPKKAAREEPAAGLCQGESAVGSADPPTVSGTTPIAVDEKLLHKRCVQELEDKNCQLRELQRRLQKQLHEQEELVERNEELEALLGEAQNQSKAEHERHECEAEGLHKKIKCLEVQLAKAASTESPEKNGIPGQESEVFLLQEKVELLQSHLVEEQKLRQQLELDVVRAQEVLKRTKEELQKDPDILKASREEAEHLNRSFTQVKAEKVASEEMVTLKADYLREELAKEPGCVVGLSAQLKPTVQEQWLVRGVEPTLSHAPIADMRLDNSDNQLVSLRVQISCLQSTLEEERLLASQHQLALLAQVTESQARAKSQETSLQQKAEEIRQLRQDFQRAQSLFSSAERELRYEREKNLDLKRHNALLDQEKIKLCAELKHAQNKGIQMEQNVATQTTEVDRLQQRVRELELEVIRNSHAQQTHTGLQEELNAERARLNAADKKVLELQQQLKGTLHQLRLEEARSAEANQLERRSREMSDTLAQLRAKLQEEQLQRKVLEQRGSELQENVCTLRASEAAFNCANLELGCRLQQLETRLGVLEGEHSYTSEELRLSQSACHKLQDQLTTSQQEAERLKEELQLVLQQLDVQIRKYNEKRSQDKVKLHRAKQAFRKEAALLDIRVQQLENDLALAQSLSEKERDCVKKVMEENENLLLEVRDLLKRLNEAEEMSSNSRRTASTALQRMNFMETENKQLQERVLMLFSQVGALERTLKKVQSPYNVEDAKKMVPPESLQGSFLDTSQLSMPGVCHTLGILDAIQMVKAGSRMEATPSAMSAVGTPASEIGYLNVTSPVVPVSGNDPEESLSLGSDVV
ncbi:coiled-coil domain-containing protein 30 isoform X2 [Brienomyrus brachyistius]|uniref:coiled-coil domain-containing protein 30 isoform X2 n=1 Tax=Brienomyrus brachyistius TaxID=42636 RepID=UPI0020B24688|nr:coiled-coil domain-containing protein 30 isoform X2 [Brienomyrus brachyistius]